MRYRLRSQSRPTTVNRSKVDTPSVAVDVASSDADVVALGETAGDDVFFPGGVLIPLNRRFVGEDNVGLAVSVDIGELEAVADLDRVDRLLAPQIFGRGREEGEGREEEKEQGMNFHGSKGPGEGISQG